MTSFDAGHAVQARDRLRVRLDILAEYDRVLRAQLEALDEDDLERFSSLSDEREDLSAQLAAVEADQSGEGHLRPDPIADDETARLMAQIHLRAGELRALDHRVLGVLKNRRGEIKDEIDRASGPMSDGAARYLEAEAGPGSDRLDVVL